MRFLSALSVLLIYAALMVIYSACESKLRGSAARHRRHSGAPEGRTRNPSFPAFVRLNGFPGSRLRRAPE